ncbi:MAG: hypothetical protein HPY50_00730 [Firmicutes bacterium]|nr:hypothetical protein [Bacillota bacterium]
MKIEGKKKYLIAVLVIACLLMGGLLVRQSVMLFHGIKQVRLPSHERRENRLPGIHSFMHVDEVAKKLGMSEAEVFKGLGITPRPGDEKLTLHALRKKYGITPEEMQSRMQKMIEQRPDRSGP